MIIFVTPPVSEVRDVIQQAGLGQTFPYYKYNENAH